MSSLRYMVFNSLIGEIALIWDGKTEVIKQVVLSDVKTGKYNYSNMNYHGLIYEENPSDYILDLVFRLKRVVMGKNIKFDLDRLDFSELTDFQKTVLLKQNEIPHKKVITYKGLSEMIGKKNSARPVANVLSTNPFPLLIPCHRTVLSDWTVGGYAGTNDGSYKKLILENEGICFKNGVVKKEYRCSLNNKSFDKL